VKIAKPRPVTNERRMVPVEVLAEGDVIEFKLTFHVSLDNEVEAWVGYGVISQVRPGETGAQARKRVTKHVVEQIQRQCEEAAELL
jgi:hypothetical protein